MAEQARRWELFDNCLKEEEIEIDSRFNLKAYLMRKRKQSIFERDLN